MSNNRYQCSDISMDGLFESTQSSSIPVPWSMKYILLLVAAHWNRTTLSWISHCIGTYMHCMAENEMLLTPHQSVVYFIIINSISHILS